ncbi:hypothetical protein [Absidia glauca]|uniref:Uncharacterized protein n=1 Tax=Absidia glauca TaxID=4829 RepID=A0A168PFZ3_ABSGL|nr:hypothetical protein [Absidia glauca]
MTPVSMTTVSMTTISMTTISMTTISMTTISIIRSKLKRRSRDFAAIALLPLSDLTTLPIELYLHKHHVLLAFPSSENKKAGRIFQTQPFEKEWTILHEKCRFLLDMDFLNVAFGGLITGLGPLESVVALWLDVVFRETHMQHIHTSSLVLLSRHATYLASCEI